MKTTSIFFKVFCLPLLCFALTISSVIAQETVSSVSLENEVSDTDSLVPFSPAYGVGVAAGLWAIPSLDFAAQVTPWLGLSLGYNHFDLKFNNTEIETSNYGFGDQTMLLNGRFFLQNLQLNAHLSLPKVSWLRLQLGAGYTLNEDVFANFAFAESVYLNDLEIKPENVGSIESRLQEGASILPFIGLGIGRLLPKKRIGLSLNGGVFYRGEPQFTVIGTEMLEDNNSNAAVLEENFQDFKWLPTLNMRLTIKF